MVRVKTVWRIRGALVVALGSVAACIDTVELGNGVTGVSGAVSISTRGYHTCVATATGGAKCWGLNKDMQLGDEDPYTLTKVEPVSVRSLSSGVKDVVAGENHSCALLLDGTVECWGASYFGQVGAGLKVPIVPNRQKVAGLTDVKHLFAGNHHTCALVVSGAIKCWGWNNYQQLGDGTSENRAEPVEVKGLGGTATVVAAGEMHSCAALAAGGVKCWGNNTQGELGNGRRGELGAGPVDVVGIRERVTALSAGRGYTCAVTEAGAVKCWGWNFDGMLGDGTTVDRETPVDVRGLASGFVGVSASARHTCAWSNQGEVWCWGHNWAGEVGDGTSTNIRLSPVRAAGVGGDVVRVAVGVYHTCALTRGGVAVCWGANNFGALGSGTTQDRLPDGTLQGGGRVNCQ
ncbi:MAG: chromosome condensation regulator RCC1 [Deltaproteobacteria bacterium]|nr:chromosome condensation regulator RCC1 [Deltaproteobacteria bacterium]